MSVGIVQALLDNASALLLDFDGPICSTFHTYAPHVVTTELAEAVQENGSAVPDHAEPLGPHDFLAWVDETRPDLTELVERRLTRAEELAVTTAPPTPYAAEVIRAASASGLRLGIVSNNAASAIERYLTLHTIIDIEVVCGRPGARLDRMKPDPWPLLETARLLGVDLGGCVLVGDSDTDVRAARAAGIPIIGYATSPRGAAELAAAGADVVCGSMHDLAAALRTG